MKPNDPAWNTESAFPFDALYYRRHAPHLSGAADLLSHYRDVGWRRGHAPSPYFDVTWYRSVHKVDPGVDALAHYLALPQGEHRDPHPAFNARWYAARYLNGASAEAPLAHYLRVGWREDARPNPLFWSDWYRERYLQDGLPAIDPFYHYITDGWRNGCDPNPLFSTEYYCRQLHEADITLAADPLSHYIHSGSATLDPHPLFRTAHFRQALEDNPAYRHIPPLQIYLATPGAPNPCPLFDPGFFEAQAAGRADAEATATLPPLVRYLALTHHRDIDPHPFFRRCRVTAPGTAEPLTHYMAGGWRAYPSAHPLFDGAAYAGANPACRDSDPLEHYLRFGVRQNAAPRHAEIPDETPRALPHARNVLAVSRDLGPTVAGTPAPRVGVFAHIFYVDLAAELVRYANNAPAGCSTVFISTDTLPKAAQIQAICAAESRHPFEIRVVENRGRDIAPMLCGFRDRLGDVDFGVHIHTKKSLHYAAQFDAWRRYLLEEVLGTPALVNNILALLSHDAIGAVAPDHYEPIKKLIQWGGNFRMIAGMLELAGEDITRDHVLDFPSGSMFWFRSAAVRPVLDMNLRPYHFDPEQGQTDGTLAHALERSFFYFVESAGYRWITTRASAGGTGVSGVDQAQSNRIFPAERELGKLRRYYAECTGILANPSQITKPRINLLVPTVDTAQGYGGVSTALNLFAQLRSALGPRFDARLLATDSTPGNRFVRPAGYTMALPGDRDQERDTVEDAAQRSRFPVQLRAGDVFVATAWWTARIALACLDQQSSHFGAAPRKMIYLVQDFEPGFYPWSTRAALAEDTYQHPDRTIAVYNTGLLRDHFKEKGYLQPGIALQPPIDPGFAAALQRNTPKEKIVLLYARPQAERNCLPFLDVMVAHAVSENPDLWAGWRFIAVGEDFPPEALNCRGPIEIAGRLSIPAYAELAGHAALGVALMVSPHPSYPPLEMAAAGMLVLANSYGAKDPSALHDNVWRLERFDVPLAAAQLTDLARRFMADTAIGWRGQPRVDWFFEGQSNFDTVARELTAVIQDLLEE